MKELEQKLITFEGLKITYYAYSLFQKIINYSEIYYKGIKEKKFILEFYKRVKFFVANH